MYDGYDLLEGEVLLAARLFPRLLKSWETAAPIKLEQFLGKARGTGNLYRAQYSVDYSFGFAVWQLVVPYMWKSLAHGNGAYYTVVSVASLIPRKYQKLFYDTLRKELPLVLTSRIGEW